MSFMKPEIWEANYYSVETSHGAEIVPVDVAGKVATVADLRDYLEGEPCDPEETPAIEHGWIARMTEPGGMNSTLPVVAATYSEAIELLRESENLCATCDSFLEECDECPECSDDCEPLCGTCGERHPVVIHDDDCEYYYGDAGECICGDNVVGRNGYVAVDVTCIDDASV